MNGCLSSSDRIEWADQTEVIGHSRARGNHFVSRQLMQTKAVFRIHEQIQSRVSTAAAPIVSIYS